MRIVGGRWKGRTLAAPAGRATTRPTADMTRERIASMALSAYGLDLSGVAVLDAFAGSGALGLELLSRGAASCTFIDRDRAAIAAVKRNIASLGVRATEVQVVRGDALASPSGRTWLFAPFSLVVLDPPYALSAGRVSSFAESLARDGLLADGARIIYEHASGSPGLGGPHIIERRSRKCGIAEVSLYRMGDGDE